MSESRPRPEITDAGVERLRARIGIAEPHPCPPHFLRPGGDAFRHVANAYGDDNPLFCDPDSDNYMIRSDSPASPDHPSGCGLRGALPVGCGPVSVESLSWTTIKSLYR